MNIGDRRDARTTVRGIGIPLRLPSLTLGSLDRLEACPTALHLWAYFHDGFGEIKLAGIFLEELA